MIARFDEVQEDVKVGNKASSLIIMKKHGFPVPDGIVIDVDTYWNLVKENEIEEKMKALLQQLNTQNIKEISQELKSLFNSLKIDATCKNAILTKLDQSPNFALVRLGFHALPMLETISCVSFPRNRSQVTGSTSSSL